MEIAPLRMDDPASVRFKYSSSTDAQMMREVPTEIAVAMERVEILHHGEERNYRPYLHLTGKIEEIMPEVELPYGASKLPFKPGTGPRMDAFYEFTDAQLAELVAKGYFTEDFEVPAQMSQITWDLPGKADYLVVAPEHMEDLPVVFVGVHDRSALTLTEASSEYDLHNYFPDYSKPEEQFEAEVEFQKAAEYQGQLRDLFADEQFDVPDVAETERVQPVAQQQERLDDSSFEKLLADVDEHHKAVEEELAADELADDTSPLATYRNQIRPKVDEAVSVRTREAMERTVAEVSESIGGIEPGDLTDEGEVSGIAPVDDGGAAERRREAEQRARTLADEDSGAITPDDDYQPE